MKAGVDGFEGEIPVLLVRPEETHHILFPRELLPGGEEGEIIDITIMREQRETDEARARVSSLIDRLREKGT